MECSYSERHERNQHLKGVVEIAERRMGEAPAAAGRREQVGTEPSRAQSQAPSNAPVVASQTSEPLLIGKETPSTDAAADLPAATGEAAAPASTRLRPRSPGRHGMTAANASWLVAST
jgi:hypothetical protein